MDVRPKVYTHCTLITWTEQPKGVISCDWDDETWDALVYVRTLAPQQHDGTAGGLR